MAIDLTNPESRQGAADALTVLIKSKYGPIVITNGNGGGSGPKLTPPKNIEIRDPEGNPVPPDQPDPQEPQDDNGSGEDKPQTKVTKTGGGNGKDTDNSKLGARSDKTTPGKRGDLFDKDKNAETMAGIKDDMEYKKEKTAKERADDLSKLTSNARVADFSELEDDLYYAIAAQVEENANIAPNWSKGGKAWADAAGALIPKDLRAEPRKTKPLIYVFFDQSGSFGQALIDKGKAVLKCLDDFVQDGQIMPPKLFIFGNRVKEIGSGSGSIGGGTEGWPQCMNIIKKAQDLPLDERCTNVLVLSDSDIEDQTDWYHNYNPQTGRGWHEIIHVEGAVFWCWANNSRARKAEEHLIGEMGNFRYRF